MTHSGSISESSTPDCVRVRVDGWNGETHVSCDSYARGGFRLEPFPSRRTQLQLDRLGELFKATIPRFSPSWLLSSERCCTVVTKLVEWNEQVRDVALTAAVGTSVVLSLHEVIHAAQHHDQDCERVVVVPSTQPDTAGESVALALADGPRALSTLDSMSYRKAVVFLNHLEYDAAMATRIALLASRRRNEPITARSSFREAVPAGVDIVLFALAVPSTP